MDTRSPNFPKSEERAFAHLMKDSRYSYRIVRVVSGSYIGQLEIEAKIGKDREQDQNVVHLVNAEAMQS